MASAWVMCRLLMVAGIIAVTGVALALYILVFIGPLLALDGVLLRRLSNGKDDPPSTNLITPARPVSSADPFGRAQAGVRAGTPARPFPAHSPEARDAAEPAFVRFPQSTVALEVGRTPALGREVRTASPTRVAKIPLHLTSREVVPSSL